jgi:predicted transposase YdaD
MNSDTISLPSEQYDSEETMHESSVIQHFTEQGIEKGIEQGIEQGERKGVLGSLLDVLESRFQTSEVHALKPTLESIEEIQYLRELLREAVQVSTLDEFKRILASNGN